MPLGTTSRSFATIRRLQAAEVAVRRLASVPELLRASPRPDPSSPRVRPLRGSSRPPIRT